MFFVRNVHRYFCQERDFAAGLAAKSPVEDGIAG
jgi:hypothetical protein